jgi:cytochrome c oxidase subunit II
MLAGIILTLVSLWYGKNHGLMPIEASDDAALVDGLFDTMMTIGTAIFLLVWGVLIIAVFKFRRAPGDMTDGPPIEGNIPLEIVWTAIPTVIVLVIGVYSFDVYNSLGGFDPEAADDPGIVQVAMLPEADGTMSMDSLTPQAAPKAAPRMHQHMALGIGASPERAGQLADVTVEVMGLQYAWIFTYPQYGITSGELHLPAGKNSQLNMKAQDVIHAFWLPEFRLKQDVLPGVGSELRFTPKVVGDYPIVCAELCGPYHGAMAARLYVQTPEEFDQWVKDQTPPAADSQTAMNPAANPAAQLGLDKLGQDRTDAEYLAPIASHISDRMGIDVEAMKQLHSLHVHQQTAALPSA